MICKSRKFRLLSAACLTFWWFVEMPTCVAKPSDIDASLFLGSSEGISTPLTSSLTHQDAEMLESEYLPEVKHPDSGILLDQFARKSITVDELAALVGAHLPSP